MKKLLLLSAFAVCLSAFGQNQSMTISHSGLSPNDTLWVTPGEQIDFIFGGGGAHPMTSGHGATASPVFFPTVTVTSTDPVATFSLTTIGTYIFHCGTNPANSANWGTIIVQDLASIDESNNVNSVILYPSPSSNLIEITVAYGGSFQILDLSGNIIKNGTLAPGSTAINVENLEKGYYFFIFENEMSKETIRFIKE